MRDLRAMFDAYPKAEEIVWVQEEPVNMGAWEFIRPHLQEVGAGRAVKYVARPRSASPAEGSAAHHAINQQAIVDQAFGVPPRKDGATASKARQDSQLTGSKG
jgi:2-oxoglutarate dehydrogenase complex dehydrogenase (E1) component-like enzyme